MEATDVTVIGCSDDETPSPEKSSYRELIYTDSLLDPDISLVNQVEENA